MDTADFKLEMRLALHRRASELAEQWLDALRDGQADDAARLRSEWVEVFIQALGKPIGTEGWGRL